MREWKIEKIIILCNTFFLLCMVNGSHVEDIESLYILLA